MSAYSSLRFIYRWVNRVLLKSLPAAWAHGLRVLMFRVARRLFPDRIKARSAMEFAGTVSDRQAAAACLPAWAQAEVRLLAQLDPALNALVADGACVEPYFIPWDLNYVGLRYADARRRLSGNYACVALLGSPVAAMDMTVLAAAARPLAVIDVDGDAGVAQIASAAGADYLALPAAQLDTNDHCAVLARLVLQLAPGEVRYLPHPLVEQCMQRHGLAMASVSRLVREGAQASPGPEGADAGAERVSRP